MTGDRIDDGTVEALLTGRRAVATEPQLSAFTAAARQAGTRPATPSRRLAAMLTTGVFTDKGNLPATAASNVAGPAAGRQVSGLPKWRRKKMAIEAAFATLAGKVAALGAAAKAAAASTVAVAAFGGAGAAGVLPAAVQEPFDRTVRPAVSDDKTGDRKPAVPSPSFGTRVSEDAKDGGVDGRQISEDAKDNSRRPDDAGRPSDLPSQVPSPAATGRPDSTPGQPATQPAQPTSRATTTAPQPTSRPTTGAATGPPAGRP